MIRRRRRQVLGGQMGTLMGSLADGSGRAGSPFVGVIDAMIAAGGAAPNFAASCSHRLYSAYTGPLIRVRHSVTTTQTDIGYGADDRLDITALNAAGTLGGAGNLTIVTLYDQGGNARDVTQGTVARQAKIYDSVTGVLLQGSLPWPAMTGTNVCWARGDLLGVTGAVAVAHLYFGSFTSAVSNQVAMALGQAGGAEWLAAVRNSDGAIVNWIAAGGQRYFNASPATTTPSFIEHAIDAGQQVQNSTVHQNGTLRTQVDLTSGTTTLTLPASGSYTVGALNAQTAGAAGGGCFFATCSPAPSAGALTALRAFGAELSALSV